MNPVLKVVCSDLFSEVNAAMDPDYLKEVMFG
jgi:hypothetical protein